MDTTPVAGQSLQQLGGTPELEVRHTHSLQCTHTSYLVKTPDYNPWFSVEKEIFNFWFKTKRVPSERASQEEQNSTNCSSMAPSSEVF